LAKQSIYNFECRVCPVSGVPIAAATFLHTRRAYELLNFSFLLNFSYFITKRQPSSCSRAPPAPARGPMSTAPHVHKPVQQPANGGGMFSGVVGTILEGMAFGAGSAIAHQAVDAVVDSLSGSGSKKAKIDK
jgi:hypothetical protein